MSALSRDLLLSSQQLDTPQQHHECPRCGPVLQKVGRHRTLIHHWSYHCKRSPSPIARSLFTVLLASIYIDDHFSLFRSNQQQEKSRSSHVSSSVEKKCYFCSHSILLIIIEERKTQNNIHAKIKGILFDTKL